MSRRKGEPKLRKVRPRSQNCDALAGKYTKLALSVRRVRRRKANKAARLARKANR